MTRKKQEAGPANVRETESDERGPLDSARLAKLRIARVAIFVVGLMFLVLGIYLVVYVRTATFFEAPFFLAIGGTGIYSALRSPDRLLIQWLGRIFIAI